MSEKKMITPMEHLNIGEFNRGQSSKLLRELAEKDNTAFMPSFALMETIPNFV